MSKLTYCLAFAVLMVIVGHARQPQQEHTAYEIDALPVIPRPRLTASQAIEIAERSLRARPKLAEHQVVSAEWVTGSHVPSPYAVDTHGASCSSLEDPSTFSWFVTFVYRDDNEVKMLANEGIQRGRFTSVRVVRVADDGSVGDAKIICVQS